MQIKKKPVCMVLPLLKNLLLVRVMSGSKSSYDTIMMIMLKKCFSTSQGRISPIKLSQSNRIISEITDIDEVDEEVTKVVQEQEKDVTLLDFEEDEENVQNDGNINENGVEKKTRGRG
ncbi:hypothetical protein JTB14_014664 [Gonioctena quinquepunctata]|nr:hypothetical protein JTB14_014664 [Gonioctena quinquepunctata]